MKKELIFAAALTLALTITSHAAPESELLWLSHPDNCVYSWRVWTDGQFMTFSGPIGFFTNDCWAACSLSPAVTVDPNTRTVELLFGPPSCDTCYLTYAPVCALQGTVGPLDGGYWRFGTGSTLIPFYIVPPPPPPGLRLLKPKGGEFMLAGSTYTIAWEDTREQVPCSDSYMLYYSSDNGENWLPVDSNAIDADCSYDWSVPSDPCDQCLMRIADADNPDVNDTTDDVFYIYQCEETIPGDLDGNCYVDFHDLNILALEWPTDPDFEAILALANRWCTCANPYDPACAP